MFIEIGWVTAFYIINILLALAVIFLERKDPTATLTWVLVLLFIPGIGFVFYILLSQNFSRKKLFKMKVVEEKIYGAYIDQQKSKYLKGHVVVNDPDVQPYQDLIKMNLFHNKSYYSQDNEVSIFIDGEEKFIAVKQAIKEAKDHIHMLYYIFNNDELGREILELLALKAQEGVTVRLLYDSIGGRTLTPKVLEPLKKAGGKVGVFFDSPIPKFNLKINYRNHRKIIVIDGKKGFLGGFNIGDEYLGKNQKFGHWRDTHIMIEGSAVRDLQTRFMLDWRTAYKDNLSFAYRYFPDLSGIGTTGIQIMSSGPDSPYERIKQNYLKMINMAQKSIYIQTPYFIPDASIMEALKIASLSGIDVRIMIPNKPDHPFVYWATYHYAAELLKYGSRIYTYENGFLHSKVMVIDHALSSVGTANFDVRSFRLNFEVNAIIYNSAVSDDLAEIFIKDIEQSDELTLRVYNQRGVIIKLKESVSRLLSPIL
ncbi:MAG: cardiolipin synthase [Tissierellales bacterium]|nr:cardiolipin synthase [Tissierellales bacterium]MBN2826528.1 cardiolipin synthase [Tissierellales bacterium]